jgi:hypothetical protein
MASNIKTFKYMIKNKMFKNASKWNKDTSEQYNIKFEYNRDKFIDLFNKVNFSDEANALF